MDLTFESQASPSEIGFLPSGESMSHNHAGSSSSSAIGCIPAGSTGVVSAMLWLPEAFHVLASSIIEKDEDRIHASGLQRCLESMHRQVSCNSGS